MATPQNALLDEDGSTELPQAQLDEKAIQEEKAIAQWTNDREYQRLKAHFEDRMEFFRRFLPNGTQVVEAPKGERDAYWVAANVIIAELSTVLNFYEATTEAVTDATE